MLPRVLMVRRMPPLCSRLVFFPLAVLAVLASGCGFLTRPRPPPFTAGSVLQASPGKQLAGATITRAGQTVATTGEDGRAEVVVRGAREGDTFEASVGCPDGHQSPAKPVVVRVARVAGGRSPEFQV